MKRLALALIALLLAAAPAFGANNPAGVTTIATVAILRAQGLGAGSAGQRPVVYLEGYSANADGGQGLLYWNSSSTATDDGCIVFQPSGLATGRYIRPVGSVVDLSWCGLSTADSGTTNLARIQAAANYAASIGASVVAHAYAAAIPVKSELVWPANTDFDAGNLTLQGVSGGSIPDGAIFYLGGTPTDLGALATDVAKYATSFALVSAPPAGVGIGSTIMLVDQTPGSFNTARSYYYNGEYATVQSVSGTTVTLTGGLRYPYPAASTIVTWVQLATARISNLNVHGISAGAGSYPIRIQMAGNGATASNICGDTAKAGGIALLYTHNFYGSNFCALNVNSTGTTENYGLVLANVDNTTVSGGAAVGPRHGVTMTADGGSNYSITNHACIVTGMFIGTIQKSDFTTAVPAADMHGNTDGCAYRNNYIDGGAQFAGARNVIQGNTISGGPCRGFSQYALNISELESFDQQIMDNRISWCGYSQNAGYGTLLDCGTGSGDGISRYTTQPGTLSITRNTFAFHIASGGVSTTNPTFQVSCKNAGSGVVGNIDLTRNTWTMTGEDSGTQGAQGVVVNVGANTVTSATWSGGTATITVPATAAPGAFFRTGSTQILTIAGASPSGYNGTYTVTIASPTTFTYAISNPGGTPATGTITWRSNWGKVDISNNTGNVAFSIQDIATLIANDVTSDALPDCTNCSFGPPAGTSTSNVDAIKVTGFSKAVTVGNFTGLGGPEYALNFVNSATAGATTTGDININGAFTLCSKTGAATCDNAGAGLYGVNPTTVDANGYGINVNAGPSAGSGPRVSIFGYQLYGTSGGTIRVSNVARSLTLGIGSATKYTLAPSSIQSNVAIFPPAACATGLSGQGWYNNSGTWSVCP